MSDLLKQAIADAKAVRATALANAKAALEEAFTPKIQSMLAEKLKMEVEGEEVPAAPAPEAPAPEAPADPAQDAATMAAAPTEEPVAPVAEEAEAEYDLEEVLGKGHVDPTQSVTEEKASPDYKKTTSGHKTEDPGKNMVKSAAAAIGGTKGSLPATKKDGKASSDYTKTTAGHHTEDPQGPESEVIALEESDEITEESLDEILQELENSLEETNMEEMNTPAEIPMEADTHSAEVHEGGSIDEMDEMVNLDELLAEEKEGDKGEEGKEEKEGEEDKKPSSLKEENLSLKKELAEYRSAVTYLRDRINEVNLLNAKLLYTNKLFKAASLNNEQKLKVIESFDLTKSVREAKLVYATLAESFSFGAKKEVAPAKKQASTTVKTITEGLASKPVASTKPTKPAVITEGAEMANRFKKLAGIRS